MTARDSTHESLARSLAPLALDGGDFSKFGGLSQLYVLEDIAQNYEQASSGGENSVKIHELFDIIVGAGTGSLVACLVGPLNLTPTDAISVYLRIHKAVFPSPDTNPPPSKEERALNLREILATVIEDCLGQEGLALNIKDLHYHHYTALTALPTVNLSSPVVFRTYDGRNGRVPAGTLLDILCATLSQPDFFPPISMGTPPEYFNSAMGIHLNPMDTVYAELCAQFSTSTLTAITSIGTGRPLPKALVVPTIGTRHTVFYDPFNSCHSTSQRFETRFSGHLNVYFRIDPDGYDPSAVSSPGTVTSHMRTFLSMQEHRLKLDQLVDTLEARNPNMAVSELISRPQIQSYPQSWIVTLLFP
ncbi:hypothetical protein DL96DRAFT_122934 [Flagelloscypha sp. PMI_526]|nr:hypothetical protein DL96DRAFT_122934 [Flagelloscypha sp. PMI_526]